MAVSENSVRGQSAEFYPGYDLAGGNYGALVTKAQQCPEFSHDIGTRSVTIRLLGATNRFKPK